MEKKKLLKRLSALGFAMYECRLYCDTHPNDTEALQMLNDYKIKYEAVKAEFERRMERSTFKIQKLPHRCTAVSERRIIRSVYYEFCEAKFIQTRSVIRRCPTATGP